MWGTYDLDRTIQNNLDNNKHIHSVRRNSDGAVFTLGDVIAFRGFATNYDLKITKIVVTKQQECWIFSNINQGLIKDIVVNPILFKSVDQVDIRRGDKIYYFSENKIKEAVVEVENTCGAYQRFSSREAVRKHYFEDHLTLSLTDVKFALSNQYEPFYYTTYQRLEEIAKKNAKNKAF